MATNTNMLVADDARNPTYYERRAGYPKPTQEWYYGGKTRDEWQLPVYTKERFVTGFDLSTGQFYQLRRRVARYLLRHKCHQLVLGSMNAYWKIEEMINDVLAHFDQYVRYRNGIERSTIAVLKIPVLWQRIMIREFIIDTIRSVQENKVTLKDGELDENYAVKWTWEWGPYREGPNFDGFFQLQHLTIVIQVSKDQYHIKVWDIKSSKIPDPMPFDINIKQISFVKLQDALAKANNSPYNSREYSLVYQHPKLEHKAVEVTDDLTFHTAIRALHTRMDNRILLEMMPTAMLNVCPLSVK